MATWSPDRKIKASGLAGIIIAGIFIIFNRTGVVIDAEEAAFITTVIQTAVAYFTPPSEEDITKRLTSGDK